MVVDTRPVLPFAELGRADVPAAGGKGASLGELLRAGIRVPDGFVVTTTAFRQAVAHLTLAGEPHPAGGGGSGSRPGWRPWPPPTRRSSPRRPRGSGRPSRQLRCRPRSPRPS